MSKTRLFTAPLLIATLFAATACDNDDPTGPSESVTVTGTIENRSGAAIPANARVIVAWVVSSGSPDYLYVFGTGTLNSNGTFTVHLDDPPPAEALNNNDLGVGLVLVTTQNVQSGITTLDTSQIVGAAEDYGIIYLRDGNVEGSTRWNAFDEGYNVGVGVRQSVGFDDFAPTSASSVRIVIDNVEDLDLVNWT